MGIGRRVSSSLDICAEAAAALDWFYFILFFFIVFIGNKHKPSKPLWLWQKTGRTTFSSSLAVCRTAGGFSAAEQDEVGVHKFQFTFKYNEFLFSIFFLLLFLLQFYLFRFSVLFSFAFTAAFHLLIWGVQCSRDDVVWNKNSGCAGRPSALYRHIHHHHHHLLVQLKVDKKEFNPI